MAQQLPILQCTLDSAGAKEQAARYAEVARHVTKLDRVPNTLSAAVDAEVDGNLLNELIDVERACCSFFTITYDGERLTYVTEHSAALDVIEEALTRR
jgi:hypothetical protein